MCFNMRQILFKIKVYFTLIIVKKNAIAILRWRDMGFERICGPKFQIPCFYVPGSLQIGTDLSIQILLTRSARTGF